MTSHVACLEHYRTNVLNVELMVSIHVLGGKISVLNLNCNFFPEEKKRACSCLGCLETIGHWATQEKYGQQLGFDF